MLGSKTSRYLFLSTVFSFGLCGTHSAAFHLMQLIEAFQFGCPLVADYIYDVIHQDLEHSRDRDLVSLPFS
jgi:hypothetical protein